MGHSQTTTILYTVSWGNEVNLIARGITRLEIVMAGHELKGEDPCHIKHL